MNTIFVIPGVVALVGGVAAYMHQQAQKWLSTSALLEAEINQLLRDARENRAFLDRDSHYWLTPGITLKSAPKAFSSNFRVFDAVLKDLHILGRTRATNVLVFYEYYEYCEKLRDSLFEHVKKLQDSNNPLLESDIAILRARLARCRAGYRILDEGYQDQVFLRHLKSNYPRPSDQDVVGAITGASKV